MAELEFDDPASEDFRGPFDRQIGSVQDVLCLRTIKSPQEAALGSAADMMYGSTLYVPGQCSDLDSLSSTNQAWL
nr:hypothetical protein CFP56_16669 [Quercus suber]